ncbi:hypothetical protein GCM10009849_36750 [Sinomonas flava]|uniref:Uncharacterized protein n=1 Tax=Sinomonas flava TaxID=496857 RepID=A0ABP5NVY0_9MICC
MYAAPPTEGRFSRYPDRRFLTRGPSLARSGARPFLLGLATGRDTIPACPAFWAPWRSPRRAGTDARLWPWGSLDRSAGQCCSERHGVKQFGPSSTATAKECHGQRRPQRRQLRPQH